ncbi:MAG: hypothetical protein KVP17_000929 [Porospora cf. gigantea B]|uniref:uncharacterized protein n=1 Tax=Porospora cf. gigantea B TaxID=2853592 RepID=UPI003571CEDF|nr:MAG: hypothetical protein KVP17_000929 [Porospora cf. gigantea B]
MHLQEDTVNSRAGSLISVISTLAPHTKSLGSDADRAPKATCQQGAFAMQSALTHAAALPKKVLGVFNSHGQKVSTALLLVTFCELIDKVGCCEGVELDTEELRTVASAIFGELAGPVGQRLIECFSKPVEECIEASTCDAAEMLKGQTCRTDQRIVGNHIVESFLAGTPGMETLDFVGKGRAPVNSSGSRYAVQCEPSAGFDTCRASFLMNAQEWAVTTTASPTTTSTPATSTTTTAMTVPTAQVGDGTALKLPSNVPARPFDVTDPEGTKYFVVALFCLVTMFLVGPLVAMWARKRMQPRRYSPSAAARKRDVEAQAAAVSYVGEPAIDQVETDEPMPAVQSDTAQATA